MLRLALKFQVFTYFSIKALFKRLHSIVCRHSQQIYFIIAKRCTRDFLCAHAYIRMNILYVWMWTPAIRGLQFANQVLCMQQVQNNDLNKATGNNILRYTIQLQLHY